MHNLGKGVGQKDSAVASSFIDVTLALVQGTQIPTLVGDWLNAMKESFANYSVELWCKGYCSMSADIRNNSIGHGCFHWLLP